jgi:ATP-dependent helicase YprA (DUF1998 family)
VTGFMPGVPSMLPLRTRISLRQSGRTQIEAGLPTSHLPPSQFDGQAIIRTLTASLVHEIQQVKAGLRDDIRAAVAEALTASHLSLNPIQQRRASPPPAMFVPDPDYDPDELYRDPTPPAALPSYDPSGETKAFLNALLSRHFPDVRPPSFTSDIQMQAVELALARTENFVAVMPTGSGKSLIFTMPPFNEPEFQTYVLVANRALLDDHLKRAEKLGLKAERWVAGVTTVATKTQLVFLALESATSQRFKKCVLLLCFLS